MIKLIQLSFARLGYIKIGDKGGTSGAPRKFDHFEIRTMDKDQEGNLIPDYPMMERLGERPTSLKIRIPFNDLDLVFPNTLAYYRGKVRFCWGDGEKAQRLSEESNGKHPRFGPPQAYGPCGETCADFQNRRCKPLGSLQVILEEQQQLGGAYVFKTTSWNSIRNILTSLTAIKAQAGGMIAWVPLTMKLVPQIVQPKDGGAANTAYIVQILFDGTPQQLLSTVRDLLAMRAPLIQELRDLEAGLKALPPAEEEAGEAADTQEEFYPDQGEMEPVGAPVTADDVEQLLSFLMESYGDREQVRQQLRQVLQIDPTKEVIGKRWLTQQMTRAHLDRLKAEAVAWVKAKIASESSVEEEDDEPIFGEGSPQEAIIEEPTSIEADAPGDDTADEPVLDVLEAPESPQPPEGSMDRDDEEELRGEPPTALQEISDDPSQVTPAQWGVLSSRAKRAGLSEATWANLRQGSYLDAIDAVEALEDAKGVEA